MFGDTVQMECFMKTAIHNLRSTFYMLQGKYDEGRLSGEEACLYDCCKVIWDHLHKLTGLDFDTINALMLQIQTYSLSTINDMQRGHAEVLYNTLKKCFVGEQRVYEISFASFTHSFGFDISPLEPSHVVVKLLIKEKQVEKVEKLIQGHKDIRIIHEFGCFKVSCVYTPDTLVALADIIDHLYGGDVFEKQSEINLKLVLKKKLPSVANSDMVMLLLDKVCKDILDDFERTHFMSNLKLCKT